MTIELTIEVLATEPIEGTVRLEGRGRAVFVGWTGLLQAVADGVRTAQQLDVSFAEEHPPP